MAQQPHAPYVRGVLELGFGAVVGLGAGAVAKALKGLKDLLNATKVGAPGFGAAAGNIAKKGAVDLLESQSVT